MGLIKAAISAASGVMADQWREFFYCEAMDMDTLMVRGQKRVSGRGSNTKGSDNVISNGSGIAVADGQCMLIVENGMIVDMCAVPGEYTYDYSSEPSLFTGNFGENMIETFKNIGRRFSYGGDAGKDQRVYYINTKEIMGNKFDTPSPIIFEVINKRIGMSRIVNVRCNGVYSFIISNPLLFYTKVCGNVQHSFTRDMIADQLKAEFGSALQPAFCELAEMELRPAQLPAKVDELKKAMNDALKDEWVETRGISIEKIALNLITLNPDDMKKIQDMEDSMTMGSNPFMMAERMTNATVNAMETAAANSAGAMNGFIGMNMAGGAMGGGQKPQGTNGWSCSCGAVNTSKFCQNCGRRKPEGVPQYRCDKCGWQPEDPTKPPRFCPECGDPFDTGDIV